MACLGWSGHVSRTQDVKASENSAGSDAVHQDGEPTFAGNAIMMAKSDAGTPDGPCPIPQCLRNRPVGDGATHHQQQDLRLCHPPRFSRVFDDREVPEGAAFQRNPKRQRRWWGSESAPPNGIRLLASRKQPLTDFGTLEAVPISTITAVSTILENRTERSGCSAVRSAGPIAVHGRRTSTGSREYPNPRRTARHDASHPWFAGELDQGGKPPKKDCQLASGVPPLVATIDQPTQKQDFAAGLGYT
jgi:hypothetical protein